MAVKNRQNIHNSLKIYLMFSQFLGFLPVSFGSTETSMTFSWKSWKILYSIAIMNLILLGLIVSCVDWALKPYNDFNQIVTHIFYACGLVALILYFILAIKWPDFLKMWCNIDKIMNINYGYPETLDKRLRMFATVFGLLGILDYSLAISSRYSVTSAKYGKNYTIEKFYTDNFSYYFDHLPYNLFFGLIARMATVYATFTWTFNDLFIILMSVCLALRFRQISDRVELQTKIVQDKNVWSEIREDYNRLANLCRELDDRIGSIILLSFLQNMIFILVQMYHSLSPMENRLEAFYFIYSFAFMIFKLITVSLYGAWVNDESKRPLSYLNSTTSSIYNVEIDRLIKQISDDNVSLTGNKMFKIKRGLILSAAGAIVTYELILIQFV